MAAASYHRRILSPKYGQTGNVKHRWQEQANSFIGLAVDVLLLHRKHPHISTYDFGVQANQVPIILLGA